MATAAILAQVQLSKSQKNKLKTGPIKNIKRYIGTFTAKFCGQYGISHWQEDVASECFFKWWKATQSQNIAKNGKTIAEQMESPQYAKRVIYNAAIQWELRYRKENHLDELNEFSTAAPPAPDFDLDLRGLNDVECLILEFHYGFGRGLDNAMSLPQIARKLKRSETWVRQRHAHALKVVEASLMK